jgi:DNA-3-methyladenine glycosylase II
MTDQPTPPRRSRARAEFEVAFDGPLDFTASLALLRRSGDDLLDRWDGEWLTRTVRIDGNSVAYTCRPSGSLETPRLVVTVEDPAHAPAISRVIIESIARLTPAFSQLCRTDPVIGWLAERHRGFRPLLHPELMVALVRCISAQQVNLRWAATVRRRLAEGYGRRHEVAGQLVYSLDPERLARCTIAQIRALQFTTGKADYVINAARAIAEGHLDLAQLRALSDDDIIARVTTIRGLGLWSAEWLLARTLGRPRVSAGDLGVRKAVGKAYFRGRMPTADEVRQATSHWGAATAFAQELLLHAQHLKTVDALPAAIAAGGAQRRPARTSGGARRKRPAPAAP